MSTKVKSPTPRQKTITLKDMNKQAKKINEYSTYTVETKDNVSMVFKYNEQFDYQKIEELLKDLQTHLKYAKEHYPEQINDDFIYKFLFYLIIKHFSNIKTEVDKEGNTFEVNMQARDTLISLGYYKLFYGEIFDWDEVMKVIDAFNELVELVSKEIPLDEETKQKLMNIQNKDVLFKKNKIIPEV